MDECVEKYRCEAEIYLLSILLHTCNIITDRGVGEPGYIREVVNELNATDKGFISVLTTTVKLPDESD